MKLEYLIRPNADYLDWPLRKDFKGKDAEEEFEHAMRKFQSQVPYYGHPYDDSLSWRTMALDVEAALETREVGADGVSERTYCWKEPAPSVVGKGKRVKVRPKFRHGAWSEHGALRQRYAFVSWEVEEVP